MRRKREGFSVPIIFETNSGLEKRREAILNWLSPYNFHMKHVALREKHVANTGTWLLEEPKFKNWIQTESEPILFWQGIGIRSQHAIR